MKAILTMGEVMGLLSSERMGRIKTGSPMTMSVAGSEFNVAVALSRLKVPTYFAGAVGDDVVGPMVYTTLRGEGVDVRFLETLSNYPTGLMIKEWYGLQPEPRVHYYRRQTAMHHWLPQDSMVSALGDGWVHISGITLMVDPQLRKRVENWLTIWTANHPGALSLDLNVRRRLAAPEEWKQGLAWTLSRASVVFGSRVDLVDLWGTDDVATLVADQIVHPDQVVIVTDGPRGVQLHQGTEVADAVPAWPTARVVDVVGAGDGFVAGALAGRYKGWDWPESLKLGSVVGAFAVSHPGDWEGYPFWGEVSSVLGNHWVDR